MHAHRKQRNNKKNVVTNKWFYDYIVFFLFAVRLMHISNALQRILKMVEMLIEKRQINAVSVMYFERAYGTV